MPAAWVSARSAEQVQQLTGIFSAPLTWEGVHAAGFYDDLGFCRGCDAACCADHWHLGDGAGRCPQGYFKSLDPHWSPE